MKDDETVGRKVERSGEKVFGRREKRAEKSRENSFSNLLTSAQCRTIGLIRSSGIYRNRVGRFDLGEVQDASTKDNIYILNHLIVPSSLLIGGRRMGP